MYELLLYISALIFVLSFVVLLVVLRSEIRDPKHQHNRVAVHTDSRSSPAPPEATSIDRREKHSSETLPSDDVSGVEHEEIPLPSPQKGEMDRRYPLGSSQPKSATERRESSREKAEEYAITTPADSEVVQSLERRASLIYWPRMCLEEEFDLVVSLHTPTTVLMGAEGTAVHSSETTYKIPQGGTVRIIPVCSGCNISPAFRDVTVIASETENRAEFKVLPLRRGEYDLTVEFQLVRGEGKLEKVGIEKTTVFIQSKPIHLQLGPLSISVTRRIPRLISMCGSVFSIASFAAARIGIDLQQSLVTLAAGVSSGLAGIVMVTLALLLVAKGIRPFMEEIELSIVT